MTRTISYDTENTDDMLWALKRVVADMYGHTTAFSPSPWYYENYNRVYLSK